jgi:hypothetical protein
VCSHAAAPSARADDGRIVAPTDDDARQFEHRELQAVEGVGHFLHLEAPSEIAHRIVDWLVYPFIRLKVQRSWSTPFDATAGTRLINTGRIATAPSQPGRKLGAPPCQRCRRSCPRPPTPGGTEC